MAASTNSSNPLTTVSEENTECTCDANLFYKRYRDEVEGILRQQIAYRETCFEEERRALDAKRAAHIKPKRDGSKDHGHYRKEETKDHRQYPKEGEIKVPKPDIEKQKTRKSRTSKTIPKKEDKQEDKKQIEKFDKTEAAQDILTQTATLTKEEDDLTKSSVRDVAQDHVDFYAEALDAKLQGLFGEDEMGSEAHTDLGYYRFDRFVESSEQTTTFKMSSASAREEGEEYYQYEPAYVEGEWMSESMKRALDYLKRHRIGDLFKFLGAHLTAANPCNPVDFLISLLDHCIKYRMGFCEPPLLYLPKHIESLFNSMDPMRIGMIEMNQYHTGMFTLGIRDYNMFPDTVQNNMVLKHTFFHEALNQLRIQLNDMIQTTVTPATVSTISTYYSVRGESENKY